MQLKIDQRHLSMITDPKQQAMLNKYKVTYQLGKNKKLVPVWFPEDTHEAIKQFLEERDSAKVHPNNK